MGTTAMALVVPWLRAWTLQPHCLDPRPTACWLCGLWAAYFTSLGLSFLICKIGIKVVPTSQW